MPKVNPDQLKNYTCKIRESRCGNPRGRSDQSSRRKPISQSAVTQNLSADIFLASQKALNELASIGKQLPNIRSSLIELLIYDFSFAGEIAEEEKIKQTNEFVYPFTQKLFDVCEHNYKALTSLQKEINIIYRHCRVGQNRHAKPLLQKKLIVLHQTKLPIIRLIQEDLDQLHENLRLGYQSKLIGKPIDKEGFIDFAYTVNRIWAHLFSTKAVASSSQ